MNRLALVFLVFHAVAAAGAGFGHLDRPDFAPARGERIRLPILLDAPGNVELRILSSDGDLVRTIRPQGRLGAGRHELVWDGCDADGGVVPDEAYVPTLLIRGEDGREVLLDPRADSGGEVLAPMHVERHPDGDIDYTLPEPARVLIRAGIKGGPMLAALANWAPRPAGKNVQRWDGFDQDHLVDLRGDSRLGLMLTAFRLPQPVFITRGNPQIRYRAWRLAKGWPENAGVELPLERNGTKLALGHSRPRYKDELPRLGLTLPDVPASASTPAISRSTPIRVGIAPDDRWLLQDGVYEVGFFLDHTFVTEEEHGYLPFTWQLDPAPLSPGRHILTVNISGLDGNVVVKSLVFEVKK